MKEIILKNGERFLLREPTKEDAKDMIEYLNLVGGESDNLLFGKNEFRLSVEEEVEYISKISKDSNALMLIGIINGAIVSIAQISCLTRKRIAHNSEIAISVRRDCWRKGIGSAVMEQLIQFAKEHPMVKNISLGVKASNHSAIMLYEKCGFTKVGIHKGYININDVYDDLILMDLYLDK